MSVYKVTGVALCGSECEQKKGEFYVSPDALEGLKLLHQSRVCELQVMEADREVPEVAPQQQDPFSLLRKSACKQINFLALLWATLPKLYGKEQISHDCVHLNFKMMKWIDRIDFLQRKIDRKPSLSSRQESRLCLWHGLKLFLAQLLNESQLVRNFAAVYLGAAKGLWQAPPLTKDNIHRIYWGRKLEKFVSQISQHYSIDLWWKIHTQDLHSRQIYSFTSKCVSFHW